jgi:hypothetical protein
MERREKESERQEGGLKILSQKVPRHLEEPGVGDLSQVG